MGFEALGKDRALVLFDGFASLPGDCRAGRYGFQAAHVSTPPANRTLAVDTNMAELTGKSSVASKDLPPEQDS